MDSRSLIFRLLPALIRRLSSRIGNDLSKARWLQIDRRVNPGFYGLMGADQLQDWRRAAASTLEWWRDAGVDTLVDDAARDWLAPSEAVAAVAPPPASAAAGAPAPPADALPESLDAFLAWRTGGDAPEAVWNTPMVPPAGPAEAELMVLVDMPEPGDADNGVLVGGASGALLDRMLAAIGLSRGAVHIAGVALARPITGRIPPDHEARLGEIARHHVSLAAPRRLLMLGDAAARAIFGSDGGLRRGRLDSVSHSGRSLPAVASFHPRFLLERPVAKAESWKDLQLLIGGNRL
ncbi:uracil-DNA glycosylase family protein [Stakelama saccharophila]|uniref:Uracil-DNA glycosylase family protein n=1 Tax=Stakelama saccharophila TaxID=3075605 RepID=A0ABZ0B524_9SPHN|nr:uracil-DNA glycosylase family protein [Stakelama sp. W311]WNO52469.1 uracil-DNA glycosylase family protein [Stakelama sp. W311]